MNTPPTNTLTLTALLFGTLVFVPAFNVQAQGRPISLPPQASEIAHGIYDLGQARDADGTIVHGFAFVHYKQGFAKPDKPGTPKPPNAKSCFAFLSQDVKWKVAEDYVFDKTANGIDALPSADDGLLADFETAVATWEIAAGTEILGNGATGTVFPSEVGELNGLNEVMFGITDPGVIAITYTWGVWNGPRGGRQLVEWDMVFGLGWGWGDEVTNPGGTAMDFLNIATHELGHAMGLDHPRDACTEETMYAYADYNETKKRTLNAGDIEGIRKLYR